jgi:hypothetical protein
MGRVFVRRSGAWRIVAGTSGLGESSATNSSIFRSMDEPRGDKVAGRYAFGLATSKKRYNVPVLASFSFFVTQAASFCGNHLGQLTPIHSAS